MLSLLCMVLIMALYKMAQIRDFGQTKNGIYGPQNKNPRPLLYVDLITPILGKSLLERIFATWKSFLAILFILHIFVSFLDW